MIVSKGPELSIPCDETLDSLGWTGLKVFQHRHGYRFSLDPVLLSAFIDCKAVETAVDLGTGNGVIPLLMSAQEKAEKIIGLELQTEMVKRAKRSVQYNGLENVITIIHGDVRALPDELIQVNCDLVTVNPPYRLSNSGRIAADNERGMARHELAGGLLDFLQAAETLLKDGGRFYAVYLVERLTELLSKMRSCKLEPKRLRMIHPRQGVPANLVLVEGRKNGGMGIAVDPPLFLYTGKSREYTEEVMEIYGQGAGRVGTNR